LTFVTTLTLKTMRTVAMPESDAFEGAVFKCTQHLPFGAMSIQFNPITYKQRSLQFHIHGVYSCYSEYTRILSTHTDTQWHTLHIDVGVYIHIYIDGYQGAKIDMLHVLPTRTDRVIALSLPSVYERKSRC
jgi:hypothetical protein